MRKRPLISIDVVTDCDTGIYSVGELDFSVHCGPLESYMKKNGIPGRNELFTALAQMVCKVQEYYESHGFQTSCNHQAQGGGE